MVVQTIKFSHPYKKLTHTTFTTIRELKNKKIVGSNIQVFLGNDLIGIAFVKDVYERKIKDIDPLLLANDIDYEKPIISKNEIDDMFNEFVTKLNLWYQNISLDTVMNIYFLKWIVKTETFYELVEEKE